MNPGCFGSIICHNADDATCKSCPLMAACSEQVANNIEALRHELNIEPYIRRFNLGRLKQDKATVQGDEAKDATAKTRIRNAPPRVRHELTPEQQALIKNPQFPVKARAEVEKLFRRGIDGEVICNALKRGENILREHGTRVLSKGAELLLKGGFTRSDLSQAFASMDGVRMTVATARSQAAIVYAVFEMMGVGIRHADGRLTLNA